jgi:nitroimidazol reductase NimA-like FMN-containing flavoprotein (pyridoxamine 5'-phosphate oxidase superfamily)
MTSEGPSKLSRLSASGVECMSREDCVTFLASTTTVGRLAFQSSKGQQLLPVNFVFRHGCVYFKTSPQSVLAELAAGCPDVAFEIDYPDRMSQHGWSVLVTGKAREVDAAEIDLSPRAPRPWATGVREVLIELTPNQISGRRIRNAVQS